VSPRLGGRPTAGGNNDERPRGGGGGGRRLRSIKKLGYIRHKQMRRQLCRTHVERAFASNPRAKILVFSDYKVDCDEIKEELFKAGVGQVIVALSYDMLLCPMTGMLLCPLWGRYVVSMKVLS